MSILLSIIIPAYNAEQYIIELLDNLKESIYNNKLKDIIEVIIVNDGSTDSTQSIVENYRERCAYKLIIINQMKSGPSNARNKGLFNATGKYIWFIDSDDLICSESINYLYPHLISDRYDLILIAPPVKFKNTIDISDNHADEKASYTCNLYELLKLEYSHYHVSFIWLKEFLNRNNLLYPEDVNHDEDRLFLISAMVEDGVAYVNLTYDFYYYRITPNSLSSTNTDFLFADNLMICKWKIYSHLSVLRERICNEKAVLKYIYFNERYKEYIRNMYIISFTRYPLSIALYNFRKLKENNLLTLSLDRISGIRRMMCKVNNPIMFVLISSALKIIKLIYPSITAKQI